jgi:hypothetical protein
MRIFWLVIVVLAALAAFMLWRSGGSASAGHSGGTLAALDGQPPQPAAAPMQPGNAAGLAPSKSDKPAIPPDRSPFGTVPPPALPSHDSVASSSGNQAADKTVATSGSSAPGNPDAAALAQDLLDSSGKAEGQGDVVADALDEGSPAPADGGTSKNVDAAPNAKAIDGKYIVAGDGSVEHPYEVTWDLLVLASQTFQPRQGKTEIPPQVKSVDGHHIKIAGYFAFPVASTDPKEVLMMLNMWDGCCVGVPPSPYDAIEVRLKEPMANSRKQFANYGTLTGTLKVDPYVQNGWLLGMYVMEDGAIEAGM